ncbi:hypothetical protein [Psychromonas sp. MME2]|uniref:STAS domain-containing protein n=1 Tax=unclassified Psychromonas TaxID=2614957 RepID=UPI00339C2CD5
MIDNDDGTTVILTGNLLLSEISERKFPAIDSYKSIKTVDLHKLDNIDSAGIAYLAQIKSNYSDLNYIGLSDKASVLAHLYGLGFIFKM